MSQQVVAYIALGANLNDPVLQVRRGIERLAGLPQSRLLAASSLWRTAPVGVANQPDYINAVVKIETSLAGETLLGLLQAMETEAGRMRDAAQPMAPRTLDLDLLLLGDARVDSSRLSLPHPRMHERAFVLAPLCEIDHELVLAGHGRAADCLARIVQSADQPIERI